MGVSDSILGGLSGVINNASAMTGDLAGGNAALQTILAELKASEAEVRAEVPATALLAGKLDGGLGMSADPYNLQQYSPWLDKASITTPTGKDVYDAIISAGLDPLSSGVNIDYTGQSWNPLGETPMNLDSLYSGYSLDNPKVLDLYTQALEKTRDARLQDAYKSAMGFDQYKPDPYENTSFGSQNYGLSVGQLGLDFSKMFESPEFANMANTWAGEQTAAAQTKDMQMGVLEKLSTDPNFKYQTTMEDWKNAAAAIAASRPAPDPYANTSFSGGMLDIGPIGGMGKPLVGYLNGLPVYAGVANGVVTLGGQYFVDPSGNLTYMEGKEGKGSWLSKAARTLLTGGIGDLVAGEPMGSGLMQGLSDLMPAGTLLSGSKDGPDKLAAGSATTGIEEYEEEIDAASTAAAERERAAARLRKGRSSTIVGGKRMSEPAILARPTILGG